jgi:mono/diheme cytochrome c family protein
LGNALSKVGYGESPIVAPYTPTYSYKAEPENVDTRNLLLGFGIPMVLLVIYTVVSQGPKWAAQLTEADKTLLAIGVGSIIVIIGAIGVVGAGLSFWFFRTTEEEAKTAAIKGPQWPSTELVGWEQKIRQAPKSIMDMTFLDKAMIALNIGLVVILLGGIAAFVVPGIIAVGQVDQALNPKPTDVPGGGGGGPVSAVPPDLQKEIDALPAGNAANGKVVFNAQACHTCHVDQPIGPAMPGDPPIGVRAATRKAGYSATAYIYESITEPSAFVVPGFNDGLMPKNFKTILKPQEIADVVAYLESLK